MFVVKRLNVGVEGSPWKHRGPGETRRRLSIKRFGSRGSDPRLPSTVSGPFLSLGRGDSLGLWLRARATSCFSSLAAPRCHAEPPVAKLVGCSLVTR